MYRVLPEKRKILLLCPIQKIQVFSVETAGVLDLDSELELYFSGIGKVKFEFTGSCDIAKIGKINWRAYILIHTINKREALIP